MKLGRKIYYDSTTGNVIYSRVDMDGDLIETTIEQDIVSFTALSERNRDTFDILELPFGAYAQDFAECVGYSVNPETKTPIFSYPDPNEPDVPQPYQQPLSAIVNEQMDYLLDVDFRLSMVELGLV